MYGTDRIHIDPFSIGRRYVPFRAGQFSFRTTRAHALRWQITPRWGCRIRNFRGPPTHQLPCRWRHSIELQPCLNRWHRCTCISSFLQRIGTGFLLAGRYGCNLQAQMHPAPTGRNLPAKGVSPGKEERALTVPEGGASTAMPLARFSKIAAMPQSLASLYVHLVFSTKDRRPFLADRSIRSQVHAYLGGISSKVGFSPILIGGVEDHVHVLACQSRTTTIASWAGTIKPNCTNWIKGQDWGLAQFGWQSGYGAFSVSASEIDNVRTYIANQESHHRKVSFQDEYRDLLREHELLWDERYVWD